MSRATRVLLVEGDEYDRVFAKRLLGQHAEEHFAVCVAGTLAEARKKLAATKYDVVALDLNLPDSTGLLTVRAVTAAAPDVPIVVLTSAADAAEAVEAVRLGAQDFLDKSGLNWQLLHRVLHQAIERQKLMNDLMRRYAAWSAVVKTLRALDAGDTLQKRDVVGFDELVRPYAGLLARTAHGARRDAGYVAHATELVRRMAECDCGVADLLDVHLTAVGRRVDAESQAGRTREDEQLVILEVMGYLLSAYRKLNSEARAARRPREG